ncbi:hypothetical protein R6242_20535 [Iodobacter sp. CM08]|uniref:type IV pilus modification PilV family protein n=1 Tax=Iodobacter sp. CM08 TaxID=3085902 RepID=UPI00298151A5|nr:hypothetical protein [Iodobacter sp. CM08]MDW5418963.1 hypothetical protein [Iodobacter sp. CM08]
MVSSNQQRGSMLLECLIGISIFSFGVLALMALQGNAMRHASSSSTRTTATQLIQRLDGEMRVNMDNLDDFQMTSCSGAKAGPAALWAEAVQASLSGAQCKVEIQANSAGSTPCSRRATISIAWPVARGANTGVKEGELAGSNQAISIADIKTISESNNPYETTHLLCGG